MELETINKLYLELSQIATATTKREIDLAQCLYELLSEIDKKNLNVSALVYARAAGMAKLIGMSHIYDDEYDA